MDDTPAQEPTATLSEENAIQNEVDVQPSGDEETPQLENEVITRKNAHHSCLGATSI